MQADAGMKRTFKLACLFTLAGTIATAGTARAYEETFEPEVQDDNTPIDFPYTPPPAPETYDQPTDVGYAPEQAAADGYSDGYDDGYDPNAYQSFEDTLSPYGAWVDDVSYGRVWIPAVALVGANFLPYFTAGHFVLSEYGWTWVSDYPWGWAPFHYGRWIVLAGYGWCWVPGTLWKPSWVS